MLGHGTKFGRKQEEAIVALLVQRSIEDAARAIGVSAKTLLRWLQMPEFQMAYRQARRDAFLQSIGRLQQASGAAAATLLKVMLDANTPAATRVRAAAAVLDQAARGIALEDLEARVSELEQAAKLNHRRNK